MRLDGDGVGATCNGLSTYCRSIYQFMQVILPKILPLVSAPTANVMLVPELVLMLMVDEAVEEGMRPDSMGTIEVFWRGSSCHMC